MIEAYIEIELVRNNGEAFDILLEMINVWSCRLIKSDTNINQVLIAMPSTKFKKMFGQLPRKGRYKPPNGTAEFIENVFVKEVKILEEKEDKKK